MKKYFDALNAVTWPESKDVMSNLAIVLFGIASFTLFFIVMDITVSKVLEKLFNA